MDGDAAHLQLAIDLGSDPISGSLSVEAAAPQPFCGWMELAAAIEAARNRPGAANPRRAQSGKS